jgi:BASS family bile acid:Na+ symporter
LFLNLSQILYPLGILFSAFLGFLFPDFFLFFRSWIPYLLSLVMLGMGLTLTGEDLRKLSEKKTFLFLGVFFQYLIMPLLGFLLVKIFSLPVLLGVGVILVGSAPGGTASNVMTYLARGDVALSVGMTTVSTLLCPLLTPLWVYFLAGKWIDVPFFSLFLDTLRIIVLPVLLGVGIRRFYTPSFFVRERILPGSSVFFISWIIGIIVALNREGFLHTFPWGLFGIVLFHHLFGLFLPYTLLRFFPQVPEGICRTVSLEVGIQNSGLAVTLAVLHFGKESALAGAFFSVIQNIVSPLVAFYWRGRSDLREGKG